jgi:S-adenosylmethionine:tRNA ribosyltransferase-isomerase
MDVAEFDFELPDELIAQEPAAHRGESRLLVMRRDSGATTHTTFGELHNYLDVGDLLVLNDTRVFPARLRGYRVPSGGAVECLLLRQLPTANTRLPDTLAGNEFLGVGKSGVGSSSVWDALVHPGQKLKPGARVVFEGAGATLHGEILERHYHGRRTVRLWTDGGTEVGSVVDFIGHIPLPPYIKRDDWPSDRERYQTVYARERGSIAAPTAGLHFTSDLLEQLSARGVARAEITLHVGYGTFKPVRVERVEEHVVDPEFFGVCDTAAAAITRARRDGRRVVAVGTTTTRALESLDVGEDGSVSAGGGDTNLFIYPGHRFRVVDAMVTNFHLPRSSLLMLVAAFGGRERVLAAYRDAVARGYRFYSYGDAMLIM